MRCDYFRLCYMVRHGGFYVDADEFYQGGDYASLFQDNRLKIQPLCYDISSATMVPYDIFAKERSDSPNWIFYVNQQSANRAGLSLRCSFSASSLNSDSFES